MSGGHVTFPFRLANLLPCVLATTGTGSDAVPGKGNKVLNQAGLSSCLQEMLNPTRHKAGPTTEKIFGQCMPSGALMRWFCCIMRTMSETQSRIEGSEAAPSSCRFHRNRQRTWFRPTASG